MEKLESFTDLSAIQARLQDAGLELTTTVEADSLEGPASITLVDPDGNPVLFDQFF